MQNTGGRPILSRTARRAAANLTNPPATPIRTDTPPVYTPKYVDISTLGLRHIPSIKLEDNTDTVQQLCFNAMLTSLAMIRPGNSPCSLSLSDALDVYVTLAKLRCIKGGNPEDYTRYEYLKSKAVSELNAIKREDISFIGESHAYINIVKNYFERYVDDYDKLNVNDSHIQALQEISFRSDEQARKLSYRKRTLETNLRGLSTQGLNGIHNILHIYESKYKLLGRNIQSAITQIDRSVKEIKTLKSMNAPKSSLDVIFLKHREKIYKALPLLSGDYVQNIAVLTKKALRCSTSLSARYRDLRQWQLSNDLVYSDLIVQTKTFMDKFAGAQMSKEESLQVEVTHNKNLLSTALNLHLAKTISGILSESHTFTLVASTEDIDHLRKLLVSKEKSLHTIVIVRRWTSVHITENANDILLRLRSNTFVPKFNHTVSAYQIPGDYTILPAWYKKPQPEVSLLDEITNDVVLSQSEEVECPILCGSMCTSRDKLRCGHHVCADCKSHLGDPRCPICNATFVQDGDTYNITLRKEREAARDDYIKEIVVRLIDEIRHLRLDTQFDVLSNYNLISEYLYTFIKDQHGDMVDDNRDDIDNAVYEITSILDINYIREQVTTNTFDTAAQILKDGVIEAASELIDNFDIRVNQYYSALTSGVRIPLSDLFDQLDTNIRRLPRDDNTFTVDIAASLINSPNLKDEWINRLYMENIHLLETISKTE